MPYMTPDAPVMAITSFNASRMPCLLFNDSGNFYSRLGILEQKIVF
jgi:hypothetical protein